MTTVLNWISPQPSDIDAVLVTRGDTDLLPLVQTLRGFRSIVVWDNSKATDFKVYGRYHAAASLLRSKELLWRMRRYDTKFRTSYNFARHQRGRAPKLPMPTEQQPIVYVQDDDCITEPARIIEEWEPGKVICNMPAAFRPGYSDGVALVGFGAVFEARLIRPAFARYLAQYPLDHFFLIECDRIFTKLNELKFVDVPVERLPSSWHESKLWRRQNHADDLAEVRRRLERLTA